MDAFEQLIDIKSIKFDIFKAAKKNGFAGCILEKDEEIDTLIVRYIPFSGDEFTHFLDRNLSLIVRERDMQVVGFMVDDFEKEFLERDDVKNHKNSEPGNSDCFSKPEMNTANQVVEEKCEMCVA